MHPGIYWIKRQGPVFFCFFGQWIEHFLGSAGSPSKCGGISTQAKSAAGGMTQQARRNAVGCTVLGVVSVGGGLTVVIAQPGL